MSYTEHPDIDATRWFDEEERKSLELEWSIEEEGKKACYNPYLIENIVEALCNLNEKEESLIQERLDNLSNGWYDDDILRDIIEIVELRQEKLIIENVMKGKTND